MKKIIHWPYASFSWPPVPSTATVPTSSSPTNWPRRGCGRRPSTAGRKAQPAGGGSAALHNNLAVALESLGKFEDAEREYQLAMKLEPANAKIQSNYNLFKKNARKDANEKK